MIDTRVSLDRLQVTLGAELPAIDQVCDQVRRFLAEHDLASETFEVVLLAREALLNAVLHGSGGDPGKLVLFEMGIEDNELVLRVEDQGPGFDVGRLDFSPAPPDLSHGRGLCIMKAYSTGLAYNDKGNALTLRKPLHSRRMDMSQTRYEAGKAILTPGRDIVASAVGEMRAEITAALEQAPAGLAIDMDGVDMIDSVGIGLLIAAHNSLSKRGQALELRGVSQDIQALFRTMRLERHFAMAK